MYVYVYLSEYDVFSSTSVPTVHLREVAALDRPVLPERPRASPGRQVRRLARVEEDRVPEDGHQVAAQDSRLGSVNGKDKNEKA